MVGTFPFSASTIRRARPSCASRTVGSGCGRRLRTAPLASAVALGPAGTSQPRTAAPPVSGRMAGDLPRRQVVGNASTTAKCRDLAFSGTLAETRRPLGQRDRSDPSPQPAFMDEVIFFHRASRTGIVADLSTPSARISRRHWPWWMRWSRAGRDGRGWGDPPIDYRISFRHRASVRPKTCSLIEKHPEHVIVADGEVVPERWRGIPATRVLRGCSSTPAIRSVNGPSHK